MKEGRSRRKVGREEDEEEDAGNEGRAKKEKRRGGEEGEGMDILKKELERKRKSLQEDFGGKKIIRRSEIEQKKIEKLRLDEQRELEAKSLMQNRTGNDGEDSNPPPPVPLIPNLKVEPQTLNSSTSSASVKPSGKKSHEQLTDEQKIDELVLSKQEVIRRLRFFKQPLRSSARMTLPDSTASSSSSRRASGRERNDRRADE